MPNKEVKADKVKIDKLLAAALPDGKPDLFGRKKRAFQKLAAALSGPHRPMFVREQYETSRNLLKEMSERLKNKKF